MPEISAEQAVVIEAFASVLAVILSIIAILFTVFTESRITKRFRLEQATLVANYKPILGVVTSTYSNMKQVKLVNFGGGTAIVSRIQFCKGERYENNLAKLFSFGKHFHWDYFSYFAQEKEYVKSCEELILVKLTVSSLCAQGFDEADALHILEQWQEQLIEIEVIIEYQDIFGNAQPKCSRYFHKNWMQ
jgi:hypothetical protein